MAKSMVVRSKSAPMSQLFGGLHIDPSTDTFEIQGAAGVISIVVKRPNGNVQTATIRAKARLTEWSNFERTEMSRAERQNLVKQMRRTGLTQSAIAKKLGISQPTVSLDLKN